MSPSSLRAKGSINYFLSMAANSKFSHNKISQLLMCITRNRELSLPDVETHSALKSVKNTNKFSLRVLLSSLYCFVPIDVCVQFVLILYKRIRDMRVGRSFRRIPIGLISNIQFHIDMIFTAFEIVVLATIDSEKISLTLIWVVEFSIAITDVCLFKQLKKIGCCILESVNIPPFFQIFCFYFVFLFFHPSCREFRDSSSTMKLTKANSFVKIIRYIFKFSH